MISKKGRIFKAIDEKGRSLWEERFPLSALQEIRDDIGEQAFQQEFMNNPVDEDNQDFKLETLQFYDEISEEITGRFAYIDPSLGKSKKADYPAIVLGYRGQSGTMYIEDCLLRKVTIEKTIENIFLKNEEHSINLWGVEFVAFQEVLKKWIDEKSKLESKYLSMQGYSPRGSKEIGRAHV